MDLALKLADYASRLQYEDLPEEAIESAKKTVLDTLGCVIDGSTAPGADALRGMVREWGGKPESSILVFGDKIPVTNAALVNCSVARAHDYDDFHEKAMVHTCAGIIPSCLAVAEKVGKVSGKDFITAIVLGIDVIARLGLSLKRNTLTTGMSATIQLGPFGSSLAAGKLLRFGPSEMLNALGISYSMVSGNILSAIEGTMMVHIQVGLSCQAGILAAMMAQRGIDGPKGVFQGQFGYFPVYQQNQYDESIITNDLGKRFEITNTSIKYFPCCLCTHAAISAMLRLVESEKIDFQEVEQIRAGVNQGSFNVVCQPLEPKRNPASFKAALFSLPYVVASALVRKHVSLEDFTAEAIRDERVLAIARKVTPYVDPLIDQQHGRTLGPAVVEVTMKNGTKKSCRVDLVKGHPDNPMSMEDCEEKFRNCLSFSGLKLEDKKVSALISAVKNLENVEDVSLLVNCLT